MWTAGRAKLAEHLEEEFGANSRKRHIAQLVDDQQLACVEVLLQRAQAAFVARFHEFMHDAMSVVPLSSPATLGKAARPCRHNRRADAGGRSGVHGVAAGAL